MLRDIKRLERFKLLPGGYRPSKNAETVSQTTQEKLARILGSAGPLKLLETETGFTSIYSFSSQVQWFFLSIAMFTMRKLFLNTC